jgi:peptidyl-prolyl cis-trans isomerase A (cyclophilin A)
VKEPDMKNALLLAAVLLAAACAKSKDAPPAAAAPAAPTPASGDTELTLEQATEGLPAQGQLRAEITTPLGTIHCTLLPDAAPKTVASFVALARGLRPALDPASGKWEKRAFFDGLAFHRVIPDFMIQGGDPLSRSYDHPRIGSGGPGFTLPDEIAPDLKFDKPGVMAMANTGPRTHSGGSQFFITEKPYASLNGGYVIFGQCDDPDVVSAITHTQRGRADKPTTAVTMTVKIDRR